MERLTHYETPGKHAYVERGAVRTCWYSMTDEGWSGPAIDRLAAYEDTGLTPEEITRADNYLKDHYDVPLGKLAVAVKAMTAEEQNEPLTLEDTLEMHGTPAYLQFPDGGEWVLIRVLSKERKKVETVHRNGITAPIQFVFEGGGKLYRRPPMED